MILKEVSHRPEFIVFSDGMTRKMVTSLTEVPMLLGRKFGAPKPLRRKAGGSDLGQTKSRLEASALKGDLLVET